MRLILIVIMCVGILVFTVGIGMVIVYHSESENLDYVFTDYAIARRDSLMRSAMEGFVLMGIGGAVTIFIVMVDDNRLAKEREKEKGFFF